MADGSSEDRIVSKQMNEITFSAPDTGHGDTKKYCEDTVGAERVKLSFYTELGASESCEKSVSRSVVADGPAAAASAFSRKSSEGADSEDRKKRCFDRYDSSESSDSGVAVLSPTESSACSGSDITEPRSPRSPESGCSGGEDSGSARMPPWASEGAPRRLAAQPVPVRRPTPAPAHRRITEFFNHKMKPQPALKREATTPTNEDTKRKCLPKNGVTHDLEKYISYLSQTLNPKVLYDVGKKTDETQNTNIPNGVTDSTKAADLSKQAPSAHVNGMFDFSRPKDNKEKTHTTLNGFVEVRHGTAPFTKEKTSRGLDAKKQVTVQKASLDPSATGMVIVNRQAAGPPRRKVPIPASTELNGVRISPATQSPKTLLPIKPNTVKVNGVVSSTTKLDSRMNGVTCGSNNLSLIGCKAPAVKREAPKKPLQPAKRTNRKSSACIANSKNLTWSKANNLKQQQTVQLQNQNCSNANNMHNSPIKTVSGEPNAPKMNIPNGVRQVSMAVNGNLGTLNVPGTNFQNCHPLNISQPCNGTVTSTHLPSFVAMPQNVMLTTLRIPQNGIPAQTINQQNNMNAFNGSNVNVSSPTKLNGQFVFPLVQNLNGAVVQIPNLMAKMPNFVLPQASQITTHRQEHIQNQQAQFLINGTLLKLANTMTSTYQVSSINKAVPVTSQSIPVMNKSVTGMPNVGVTVQSKPNFTVNLSHSVLMPQPGFIVTSVPNMNVKETWSYTTTHPVPLQTSCSNPIVHHPPPMVANFSTPNLHSSTIPITPLKPPENPIQGTDPPSSTVKEPEVCEAKTARWDVPWLSKTSYTPLDSKLSSRPFAEVGSFSEKLADLKEKTENNVTEKKEERKDNTNEDLRKFEEVARREETLFTQITVLKDVSSNVQNSLIEANFCSATTESSESGIGTDKSIASPSDSHTSKECDEDSSLSLSVSVCSSVEVPSQKSPILKQPKTLRFPPKQQTKSDKRKSGSDTTSSVTVCLWENCKSEFESDTDLLEHLQTTHVETQAGKENYVCMWAQCKVRGKPSCSRLWLERHALSHGGNKPFKCIVDGCDKRFSTQILLERHVNNHFNETSPNTNGPKKSADNGAKLIRRNGKKLRYRRQPWSARMFDFFDAGTMEGLCYRLARATRWRLGGSCPLREPPGRHTLTLHATLTATRYNTQRATTEALLTYYPPNVIEDEWVAEKDVKRIKRVEIAELPIETKVILYDQFCASYRISPSQPPEKKTNTPAKSPRVLPPRHCTSSRLLNNLLSKQREARNECSSTNIPIIYKEEQEKVEVSGAKKRKMGRRQGGNCFWPCGR